MWSLTFHINTYWTNESCGVGFNSEFILQFVFINELMISYETERKVFDEVMKNRNILVSIRKNIHVDGVLKDMETALTLDKNSEEYKALLDKVINVGETKM